MGGIFGYLYSCLLLARILFGFPFTTSIEIGIIWINYFEKSFVELMASKRSNV